TQRTSATLGQTCHRGPWTHFRQQFPRRNVRERGAAGRRGRTFDLGDALHGPAPALDGCLLSSGLVALGTCRELTVGLADRLYERRSYRSHLARLHDPSPLE